ncbi:MAG TPA: hypothetical protein VG895_02500 [Patescibacteria group bacterium]|nr:hypothetical protein [Patescibacteria group bacterium]
MVEALQVTDEIKRIRGLHNYNLVDELKKGESPEKVMDHVGEIQRRYQLMKDINEDLVKFEVSTDLSEIGKIQFKILDMLKRETGIRDVTTNMLSDEFKTPGSYNFVTAFWGLIRENKIKHDKDYIVRLIDEVS